MTTIRRQLTRNLLLAFAVPILVGGVIAYALIRDEITEQFDAALRARALGVAAMSGDSALRMEEGIELLEHEGWGDEDVATFVEVRTLDGSSVARSASLGAAELPFVFGTIEEPRVWNLALPTSLSGRAVGFQFAPGAVVDRLGTDQDLVIVLAADRRALDAAINGLAAVVLLVGALVLGATFVVVPRVVRRAFAPLDALAQETSRITASSLGTRFASEGLPGELVPICDRLNDLLARLETSFEREQQFSGDLAHELRTPLAELRSLAEVAIRWPETRRDDTDTTVLAIASQMENTVSRLLALLRAEEGRVVTSVEPVDVTGLLQEVWTTHSTAADARGLQVMQRVRPGLVVRTDAVLLRSILSNLLENAIEYAPEGDMVEVAAAWAGSGTDEAVRVTIANTTQGLTHDDVGHLFDRLWRQESSRSDGRHAGLGLALARAFARALAAPIGAELNADRLVVSLQIPKSVSHDQEVPCAVVWCSECLLCLSRFCLLWRRAIARRATPARRMRLSRPRSRP